MQHIKCIHKRFKVVGVPQRQRYNAWAALANVTGLLDQIVGHRAYVLGVTCGSRHTFKEGEGLMGIRSSWNLFHRSTGGFNSIKISEGGVGRDTQK